MFSPMTVTSRSRNVRLCPPRWGLGIGQGDQFRLAFSIEDALSGGGLRMLAGQDGVDALFYQSLARPSNRIDVGLQGSRNPAAAPGFARVRRVSLQRNARVQQLPHLVLGLADQRGQPVARRPSEPVSELIRNGKSCG